MLWASPFVMVSTGTPWQFGWRYLSNSWCAFIGYVIWSNTSARLYSKPQRYLSFRQFNFLFRHREELNVMTAYTFVQPARHMQGKNWNGDWASKLKSLAEIGSCVVNVEQISQGTNNDRSQLRSRNRENKTEPRRTIHLQIFEISLTNKSAKCLGLRAVMQQACNIVDSVQHIHLDTFSFPFLVARFPLNQKLKRGFPCTLVVVEREGDLWGMNPMAALTRNYSMFHHPYLFVTERETI